MTARLCEANASFSSTRSRSADVDAGPRQQLRHRRNGPDAHHARVDAGDRRGDERAERLDAELGGALLARDHERGGAVVQPARVARP